MAFCIPASQYDENIHDIVSGPSTQCTGCGLTQSSAQGGFFNLDFGGPGFTASVSESLSFNVTSQNTEKLLVNKSAGNYIMALAVRGEKKYNEGWQFHLDPDTYSFTDTPWMRYDIVPSEINNAFVTTSIESMPVCFDISGVYKMELTGRKFCDGSFNISWEAERQQGPTGPVQCGMCSGECPPGFQRSLGDGTYETCLDIRPVPGYSEQAVEDYWNYIQNRDFPEVTEEDVMDIMNQIEGQSQ